MGTKGHTQVIGAHLAESYTSQVYYHGNQRSYTGHCSTSYTSCSKNLIPVRYVTIGTKGHTEVIVAHLTESYTSQVCCYGN